MQFGAGSMAEPFVYDLEANKPIPLDKASDYDFFYPLSDGRLLGYPLQAVAQRDILTVGADGSLKVADSSNEYNGVLFVAHDAVGGADYGIIGDEIVLTKHTDRSLLDADLMELYFGLEDRFFADELTVEQYAREFQRGAEQRMMG